MSKYFTKDQLYFEIHQYKNGLGLDYNDYGFDMLQLCKKDGIKLAQLPFKTKHLRGMASIGAIPSDDVILLNNERNDREQNFDCGHEYVHLCIHRNLEQKTFNCLYAKQDTYIEWQANEGAAEMLIPFEVLLPLIKNGHFNINDHTGIKSLKEYAATMFNVTKKVIEYRLESLKYEIYQYLNGIPLSKISKLSLFQQKKLNINIQSLNDIESVLLKRDIYSSSESKFINYNALF